MSMTLNCGSLQFVEFTEFQHEALKAEVQLITKQIEADMQQKNTVWRQKELQKLHVGGWSLIIAALALVKGTLCV